MLVILKTKVYKSELKPGYLKTDCDLTNSPFIRVAENRSVAVETDDIMLLEEGENGITIITLRSGKELSIKEALVEVLRKIAMTIQYTEGK